MEKLKVTNLNITSDEAIIQEMKQSLKNVLQSSSIVKTLWMKIRCTKTSRKFMI